VHNGKIFLNGTAMEEELVATAADKIETSKQLLNILESSFETKVST